MERTALQYVRYKAIYLSVEVAEIRKANCSLRSWLYFKDSQKSDPSFVSCYLRCLRSSQLSQKMQQLEDLCFNQVVLNDIIKNQYELSVLSSKKSELSRIFFGKLIVLERFLYKSSQISDCNRSQALAVCSNFSKIS